MAEVRPEEDGARRRIGAYVIGVLAVLWFVIGVALVTIVGLEALTLDDTTCPVEGLDSVYGDATWQTWPPGKVCTFAGTRLVEPAPARGAVVAFEIVVGVALVVVWRRYRHAADPDWAA
jgi:ABC-type nickel/cobalt efflux system permease component RcnA